MIFFKNHQLKTNFLSFWIIGFIYLISISQISSKNLEKRLLSKNKSFITNDIISTILNNNNELKKSKRKTNNNYKNQNYYNYRYDNNYTNENNTYNSTKYQIEYIGVYLGIILLFWFAIFFVLALYLICMMKKFEQTKSKTRDVWFYLYLSNIGILLISGVKIASVNNVTVDDGPFGLCLLFFFIMTFNYYIKFYKECNREKTIICLSCDTVTEWARLPCFILVLLGLTDPCCTQTTYTVTTYADGHTENDLHIVEFMNLCVKVIKRVAYFFSVISFYFGLLFVLIFWVFIKIIFLIVIRCIINSNMKKNQNNVKIIQNNNQYNNPNDINSKDIIMNNKFDPKILNNGNIYFSGNNNIPNNYDKQTNAEGLEVSENKKEEYEQNNDLPNEEEIKNNKIFEQNNHLPNEEEIKKNKINNNEGNENSLNKESDKGNSPEQASQ